MAVTRVSKFYQVYFQLGCIFVSNVQQGEQSMSVTLLSNSMKFHSFLVAFTVQMQVTDNFITIDADSPEQGINGLPKITQDVQLGVLSK